MQKGPKARLGSLVELSSPTDLGRHAFTFESNIQNNLCAFTRSGRYNVLSFGETIGGSRLLYYYPFASPGNFGRYYPGSPYIKESFDLANSPSHDPQSYNMPIIELSPKLFDGDAHGAARKVINAHVSDYKSIIKGMVNRSLQEESIGRVYAFDYKRTSFIGSFDLLSDDSVDILSYSETPRGRACCFYSYDYTNDIVQETDRLIGNTFIYVRVINLARSFDFFKPE
jgi:hypothetical protein